MENLWEKIAINLADSQAPSLLVAEVDTAMNHNELVKLKVGDHIKWLGDDLCHSDQNGIEKLHLPHAAIGKVLQVSDNPLVQYVEKELGVHIGDASWALVQFQNGFRMVLRPPQKFQKIEAPAPLDPDWKPEEPEDYYKKETLAARGESPLIVSQVRAIKCAHGNGEEKAAASKGFMGGH